MDGQAHDRAGARWTALDVVRWTAADLARRGVPSSRLEAELLVARALGSSRVGLYVRHDAPLTEAERAAVRDLVRRRRTGEPTAYILGEREFWSIPVRVDGRVLIPRPETETLVEEALTAMPDGGRSWRVADVGAGSGAVAMAVAVERPAAAVLAIDVSPDAIDVARENVAARGLGGRIELLCADGPDALAARPAEFDSVLANLPYVASAEIAGLPVEIRDHEPRSAIDGGPDGLREIRRAVPAAAAALRPGGALLLEIGADQADAVRGIVEACGAFGPVRIRNDYAGLPRVAVARREGG